MVKGQGYRVTQKLQKHIGDDRVAGVSLHSIERPAYVLNTIIRCTLPALLFILFHSVLLYFNCLFV